MTSLTSLQNYSKYRIFYFQKRLFILENRLDELYKEIACFESRHLLLFRWEKTGCVMCERLRDSGISNYIVENLFVYPQRVVLKRNIEEIIHKIKFEYFRLLAKSEQEYYDVIWTYKSKYVPMHVLLYELDKNRGKFNIKKVLEEVSTYEFKS